MWEGESILDVELNGFIVGYIVLVVKVWESIVIVFKWLNIIVGVGFVKLFVGIKIVWIEVIEFSLVVIIFFWIEFIFV